MIGAGYGALTGEYGLAWQVVSLLIVVAVELVGFFAGFALVAKMFGWWGTRLPQDLNSEEVPARDPFYEAPELKGENAASYEAGPDEDKRRGIWLPHPDDPSSAEAS
jgi:hypothetical protein